MAHPQILKYSYISNILARNQNAKIISLDIGTKKVGIAVFYNTLKLVLPSTIISTNTNVICDFATKNEAIAIVIGIPINTKNNKSNNNVVEKMVGLQQKLQHTLCIPVFLHDEKLTTYVANEMLKDIGMKRKNRNKIDDTIAAQLILESFMAEFNYYIRCYNL